MITLALNNFYFKDKLEKDIYVYKWTPEGSEIKGVVQIAHGMAEHAGRYNDFARFLNPPEIEKNNIVWVCPINQNF